MIETDQEILPGVTYEVVVEHAPPVEQENVQETESTVRDEPDTEA